MPFRRRIFFCLQARLQILALGIAGVLIFGGCGPNPVVLSGSADDAQELLAEALQAWQSGQKPEDLRSTSPAVHVADEDWEAGKVLRAFEASATPIEQGGHWRVSAVLTLAAAGQPEEKKAVAYAVTTDPAITIIRVDDVQ